MSRERDVTLGTLARAARDLAPTIRRLNRRQRHAARVRPTFAFIKHELYTDLGIWSPKENAVYQFEKQVFGEGCDVTTRTCTLGHCYFVVHFQSEYERPTQLILGGWRRRRRYWRYDDTEGLLGAEPVRLLVVDDGVPALFWERSRYSGDVSGLQRIFEEIGWPELHA